MEVCHLTRPGIYSKWDQEYTRNQFISRPRRRSPLSNFGFPKPTSFHPTIQDFTVKDQRGQHFFRFRLVNAATITCSSCFRNYFISLIGTSLQYQIPNQVECLHCRQLIQIPASITSQNKQNNQLIVPEEEDIFDPYQPTTRVINTDQAGLLDLDSFLLNYGKYFASHITTMSFMRIKLPKRYPNSEDSWGLVFTCLTDQTLRIHTVDTEARQVTCLNLRMISLQSSELPVGLSEIMLKNSNGKRYTLNGDKAHKWFQFHLINKMSISTPALDNGLQKFHSKPSSIIDKPTPTGFLSRLRQGAFKKKKSSPNFNLTPEKPNEQLTPFYQNQKKSCPSVYITRLSNSRRSVPNLSLHYLDSPSHHSRVSSVTITASSDSSLDVISTPSSPHSDLGLDFYYRQQISTKQDHNWLPNDSNLGGLGLDVNLYPFLPPTHDISPGSQTSLLSFLNHTHSIMDPDILLLLDQFPTPPPRQKIY